MHFSSQITQSSQQVHAEGRTGFVAPDATTCCRSPRALLSAQRATEGAKAMSDYKAEGEAERAKTARLKELRLAKEAAHHPSVNPAYLRGTPASVVSAFAFAH